MIKYSRICAKCSKEIIYKKKKTFKAAMRYRTIFHCIDCCRVKSRVINTRSCKTCNKEIKYKNAWSYNSLLNKKTVNCKHCVAVERQKIRPLPPLPGKSNPMFGKSIYDIWEEKYDADEVKKRKQDHAEKSAHYGEDNGMFGRSVYDAWVEKYGKEEADVKIIEHNKNKSRPGKQNGQYGKTPLKGSGNGWHGSLDGVWFRSLMELSYLFYLIENKILFENAEKKMYAIQYTLSETGADRTYYADFFLIETGEFIEVKPKILLNTKINIDKFIAAKEKLGNKFVILTEDELSLIKISEIDRLISEKRLIFPDNILEKYLKYKEKHKE